MLKLNLTCSFIEEDWLVTIDEEISKWLVRSNLHVSIGGISTSSILSTLLELWFLCFLYSFRASWFGVGEITTAESGGVSGSEMGGLEYFRFIIIEKNIL